MAFKIVVRCKQCGERRRGDALGPACPNCGLLSISIGSIQIEALGSIEASANLQIESMTYPRELMSLADRLINERRSTLAVIVVHMACEVAAEMAISEAFDNGGAKHLKNWVRKLRLGHNLANSRVRMLYTAVTGDNVAAGVGAEWSSFKVSSTLRNDIIHQGKTASETDAKASYKAADALLRHLESRMASSS